MENNEKWVNHGINNSIFINIMGKGEGGKRESARELRNSRR